jgi:threonine/homoserine/homoserine lactone efflux protein
MPPLGPTYFAIIERGLKKQFNNAVAIGVGAGFIDMIYILIAFGGVAAIISLLPDSASEFFNENEETFKIVFAFIGCIVVILYGIKIMRTKGEVISEKAASFDEVKFRQKYDRVEKVLKKTEVGLDKLLKTKKLEKEHSELFSSFMTGVVMCLSSVTLPASWFAAVGYFKGVGLIDSNIFTGILLAIGVLIGTSVWFFLMTKLIFKYTEKISPSVLNKLNLSTGIFLVVLGVGLLIKVYTMYF